MAIPFLPPLRPAQCGDPGDEIAHACVLSSGQYLQRTVGAATNSRIWTLHTWLRRGALSAGAYGLLGVNIGSGDTDCLAVRLVGDMLSVVGGTTAWRYTSRLFRDPAAWYAITIAVDTTQAVADDRIKIFVAAARITDFATKNNPPQNSTIGANLAGVHQLGQYAGTYFDGALAATHFVDGQALGPEAFGYTNRVGVWVPRRYAGAYGAQGWHLDFADPLVLGKDVSGNGNHWTTTGLTATNQVTDTPTHTYATWTPLRNYGSTVLSGGNLTARMANTIGYAHCTIDLVSGRWYWEVRITEDGATWREIMVGLASTRHPSIATYYFGRTGAIYGTAASATGASFTTGDIIGVSVDCDNLKVTFSRNGVPQGTAVLAVGDLPASPYVYSNGTDNSNTSATVVNFGQRPFQFAPPAGYLPLSTANLPCPAIKRPDHYFTIRERSFGAGITDLPWSPRDHKTAVLIKRRDSNTTDWRLNLSIHPGRAIATNGTAGDIPEADGLTFTADGYVLGAAEAYQGSRLDYIWRASRASGFDVLAVDHVTGNATTLPHAVGGIVDYAWVINLSTGAVKRAYHRALAAGKYLPLNATNAAGIDAGWFASTAVDLTLGAGLPTGTYAVLAWRTVPQFSAFGLYTGNASTDGPMVTLDFAPRMMMLRPDLSASNTWLIDTTRTPHGNPVAGVLCLDMQAGETSVGAFDMLSNGMKVRTTYQNASGYSHAFAAWADTPGKFARAR